MRRPQVQYAAISAGWRGVVTTVLTVLGVALAAPLRTVGAQIVVPCDFDIADDKGIFNTGNTIRLIGRAGAGTTRGSFFLSNGNTPESDQDKDGYGPACTFNNLFVALKDNLANVANEALSIPGQNIIVLNFPRRLDPGESGEVSVFVDVPPGTVAGVYQGRIVVRDQLIFSSTSPSGDVLNLDRILIEVVVLPESNFSVLDPDRPEPIDSVLVRGRAGTRASGVFRIANAGNTTLEDTRFSATDLRSESAVGLVIPAQNVTFTPEQITAVNLADTVRVTVSVQIPRGLLGGRYRGAIIVQSAGGPPGTNTGGGSSGRESNVRREIPLVVVVTSNRGILFANNPVRSALGDIAQIAFNGDPGTTFQMGIFDVMGMAVYRTSGTVFAGQSLTGTPGTAEEPQAGADFAVNLSWPLVNGRGEAVASGMYVVIVESIVAGRRQVTRDRLMVIR